MTDYGALFRELEAIASQPAPTIAEMLADLAESAKDAARTYLAYKTRAARPAGAWHNGSWYPADSEVCDCCRLVVDPVRAGNPYTLLQHCRGKRHLAKKHGVTVAMLDAALRELQH